MPKEMPDVVAIEYCIDDVGMCVFANKEDAQNALNEAKANKNVEDEET